MPIMKDQNKSCEPMDIDLSSHSADMEVSYNDSIHTVDKVVIKQEKDDSYEYNEFPMPVETIASTPQPLSRPESKIKKYHINKLSQERNSHHIQKLNVVSLIVVLFLSIIAYHIVYIKCSDNLNLEIINGILSTRLYGQTGAIKSIVESLNVTDRSKILFFYGGTGVGKTYAASLILENVGYNSNIYHYTMPSFTTTFSTDFMIGLSACKTSIVIVDDLNKNDMHIKEHINEVIAKSENLGNIITVILIYNCDTDTAKDFFKKCDDSFSSNLLENFRDTKVLKKLVKFESLTEEHLRKCIEHELNRTVSDLDFNRFMKNFNVTADGCKGVHTKMKFLDSA